MILCYHTMSRSMWHWNVACQAFGMAATTGQGHAASRWHHRSQWRQLQHGSLDQQSCGALDQQSLVSDAGVTRCDSVSPSLHTIPRFGFDFNMLVLLLWLWQFEIRGAEALEARSRAAEAAGASPRCAGTSLPEQATLLVGHQAVHRQTRAQCEKLETPLYK